MSSRQTTQKVREFELTLEDAGRLAECLNSFDDSDSWPGGFTHGNPFTAERVLKSWSKENNLRVIVGYSDDKIVGHCNVGHAELDTEAAYVGLLGVNPQYQGQGFGKAMLIEAAQAAAEMGKRRIDLHTWAGNLKAVPLYKRTGYNWVPGTKVLMESHIPGILGAEMFKEFFERYDWYDSFKVDITQEMDDFVEDNFGIFRYHFEGENGDLLHVTIDREAKGISGFILTLDGNTISADVRPTEHVGYIGLGSIDMELKIQNSSSIDYPYSVNVQPIRDVSIELEGEFSGTLSPQAEVSLTGTIAIKPEAIPLDKETNTFEKAKTQGEFTLTLRDREIKLFSGVIPTEALAISAGPMYPCITPGEVTTIGLGLQNNSQEQVRGEVELHFPTRADHEDETIDFQLDTKKAIELPVKIETTEADDNTVLPIKITVFVNQESTKISLLEKTLNIPVIGSSGAVVYEGLGEHYILETESIRAGIRKTPSMAFTYFEYKPLHEAFTGWGVLPDIGYPFSGEGSEWYKTEFKVDMRSSKKTAEIELTAESEERPGLRYTITHRIHSGLDLVDTNVKLENIGSEVISNLGVQTHGWYRILPDQMHVPLRNEIVSLNSVEWNGRRQLPRSPKEYHETWLATSKQSDGLQFGWLWNPKFIEDVVLRRTNSAPVFEYKLPDLKPDDTVEFTPCRFIMTQGNWEKIRDIWTRINGVSESTEVNERTTPRSDLEIEVVHKASKIEQGKISPMFIDSSMENEMELRVRVVHEDPITADCSLQMPKGLLVNGNDEISFKIDEISIDKPFHLPIKVTAKAKTSWFVKGGEIVLKFPARIVRESVESIVYDSSLTPECVNTVEEEKELMTTTISDYAIAVSPQNIGSLVRYGKVGEPSMFYDTFPKLLPFIWWDKVYSGVTPVVSGFDVWDWETALFKEKWTITEIKVGSWIGYEAKATLQYSPGLKGLEVTMRFFLLSGTPLIRLEVQFDNSSGLWKRPFMGFRCIPTPGGDAQSNVHTIHQTRKITFEPTGNESDIWASPEAGWSAYEGQTSGKILGIVSTIKTRESLAVDTLGDKAHHLVFRTQPRIESGSKAKVALYLFDAQSIEQIELLKNLPVQIE
ncbi:MAG: GNAT family N-acetyltransferase [Candidatus Thorarchaeota archaeon]